MPKGLGGVAGGNRAGGVRKCLHDDDGLATQGGIFLPFARCKEGVEIEEKITGLLTGYMHPIRARRVFATGTTVTTIVGWWT
jgi:hypothetical protein